MLKLIRNIKFLSRCLLVLFILFAATSCFPRYTGQFILINETNELITLAQIKICKQPIEIKNIKPYEKVNGMFNITSDSHYDITIYFASGKKLSKQIGYVTHGFNFWHTLAVTREGDITIKDSHVK